MLLPVDGYESKIGRTEVNRRWLTLSREASKQQNTIKRIVNRWTDGFNVLFKFEETGIVIVVVTTGVVKLFTTQTLKYETTLITNSSQLNEFVRSIVRLVRESC
ncbi:MAG: hypothetical protein ACTS47_02630 [Candidatus Hodgkinia cicadicola]